MKTKVENQKNQVKACRYSTGESSTNLVSNVVEIMTDYSEEVTNQKLKISFVHPEPYKLELEFYLGDIKICTVFHHKTQNTDGFRNLSWIVWHNDLDGVCFQVILESKIGFPDCIEILEDEEVIFIEN